MPDAAREPAGQGDRDILGRWPADPTPGGPAAGPGRPRCPSAARWPRGPRRLRVDDWYWLRDQDDPEVLAHLEAENAYTEAVDGRHPADSAGRSYAEIVARIEETDLSVPVRKGPWWYYGRTVEGSSYAIHCRRPAAAGRPRTPTRAGPGRQDAVPSEQVLLDENLLAEGHDYLDVANLAVSPDHRLAGLRHRHHRRRALHPALRRPRDRGRSRPRRSRAPRTGWPGPTTTPPSSTSGPTPPSGPTSCGATGSAPTGRRRPGLRGARRPLPPRRGPDQGRRLRPRRPRLQGHHRGPGRSTPTTRRATFAVDRAPPPGRRVQRRPRPGRPDGRARSRFLILTNDGAENFRLMAAPDDRAGPGRTGPRSSRPRPGSGSRASTSSPATWSSTSAEGGETRIRVDRRRRPGASTARSTSPSRPRPSWGGANPEYDATVLRYEYSSLVTPRSVYDLDLETGGAVAAQAPAGARRLRPGRLPHRAPLGHGRRRDPGAHVAGLPARPGRRPRARAAPRALPPLRLRLLRGLDRPGLLVAAPEPARPGLRLRHRPRPRRRRAGPRWYEEGKLAAKPNTFTDFVACARHLVDEGWTTPDRLVARGGSAGGLLMGAVANLAPELFRAMVAEVPFVDCLTTILDETLPLTVIEWEEWGNPVDDPEVYRVMKSYSPYDNVRSRRRRRAARSATPTSWPPAGWRTRGSASGSRPSGWPSCGPPTRRTGSCSRPSSAPATAGRRGATTPGGTRRSSRLRPRRRRPRRTPPSPAARSRGRWPSAGRRGRRDGVEAGWRTGARPRRRPSAGRWPRTASAAASGGPPGPVDGQGHRGVPNWTVVARWPG